MKMIKNVIRFSVLSVSAMLLDHSASTFAGTSHMVMATSGDKFNPPVVNISAGDSVIWQSLSGHTTTSGNSGSADGLWDSSSNPSASSYTNTFSDSGTFNYYCAYHYFFGMTGAVFVAAASLPPSIAITNPAADATFSAPATFTLVANTTNTDITGVEFFNGTTSLGNVTVSPYSTLVDNLTAGDYTFSAVATDSNSLTATNSIAIHVVTPTPIVLGSPQSAPPNGFQFTYSANIGLSYVVQQSSTFSNWISLSTNVAASGAVTFTDTNAIASPGFYRVCLLPNP